MTCIGEKNMTKKQMLVSEGLYDKLTDQQKKKVMKCHKKAIEQWYNLCTWSYYKLQDWKSSYRITCDMYEDILQNEQELKAL